MNLVLLQKINQLKRRVFKMKNLEISYDKIREVEEEIDKLTMMIKQE